MEHILEVIYTVIVEVIFSFVGAFFRWIFFLCRKPFEYYCDTGNDTYNSLLGMVITIGVIALIYKAFH